MISERFHPPSWRVEKEGRGEEREKNASKASLARWADDYTVLGHAATMKERMRAPSVVVVVTVAAQCPWHSVTVGECVTSVWIHELNNG